MRLFGAKYRGESSEEQTHVVGYSSAKPVTAAEVRDYLQYGSDSQDTIIDNMISEAISSIEKFTGQGIVNKTYVTTWDAYSIAEELPYYPVNKIEKVYRLYNGEETEITDYNTSGGQRRVIRPGAVFSSSGYYQYGLKVMYQAGILVPVIPDSDTDTFDSDVFTDGQVVTVSTYGTLPTGLTAGKTYYVVNSGDTFQLSESVDGDPVGLTDTGEGQLYIGTLDEDLRQLIIKQAASYFNRGESSEGLKNEVKTALRRAIW